MSDHPSTLTCPPHDYLDLCARDARGEFEIWMVETCVWRETGRKTRGGKPERVSSEGYTVHMAWPHEQAADDGTPEPEACGPLCICGGGFQKQPVPRLSRSQRELIL